jgi:chromosome segregation ATPase
LRTIQIEIENFKGVKHGVLTFDGKNARITGENGSGKSTYADAHAWMWMDTDYAGNSKPDIRPDGADCDDGVVTRVTETIQNGDKTFTFEKIQKVKTSKPDAEGKVKVTKVNSYSINSVPKSQRDAFSWLADNAGLDEKLYPILSSPDALLRLASDKKGRTAVRDILFGMADKLTDAEVASKSPELKDIYELLQKYTVEEITAMQNSSKRKIREDYGRNGEILDSRIGGLLDAKTEVDEKAVRAERQKNSDAREILESRKIEIKDEINKLRDKKAACQKSLADGRKACAEKVLAEREKLLGKKDTLYNTVAQITAEMNKITLRLNSYKSEMNTWMTEAKRCKAELDAVKERRFTGGTCPTCGQKLPAKRLEAMKVKFEKSVADDTETYTKSGIAAQEKYKSAKAEAEKAQKEFDALKKKHDKTSAERDAIGTEIADITARIKTAENEFDSTELDSEIAGIDSQIARLEKEYADCQSQLSELNAQASELNRKFALIENNLSIDAKVEQLKKDRIAYEQAKADCEKILDQLATLEMMKNQLAQDSINAHFNVVKWKLFDRQANGELRTDLCEPMVDGHDIAGMNTGRLILAKLDICNALQKFYGKSYPVWLDNAECLTSNTTERIKMDAQLIMLCAVEGQKELRCEVAE